MEAHTRALSTPHPIDRNKTDGQVQHQWGTNIYSIHRGGEGQECLLNDNPDYHTWQIQSVAGSHLKGILSHCVERQEKVFQWSANVVTLGHMPWGTASPLQMIWVDPGEQIVFILAMLNATVSAFFACFGGFNSIFWFSVSILYHKHSFTVLPKY